MALSAYQIKRWYLMLAGKSAWHVRQDIGKSFSTDEIKGYYNDLTEKVKIAPSLLDGDELPVLTLENGSETRFPVAIFQYGLGAYDLFLQTANTLYERKFWQCVGWTVDNVDGQSRWNNFSHYCPEHPYSAMAQGEAASLLIRAYVRSGEGKYMDLARKAIDYMLLPVENGGTTSYMDGDMYLLEYTFTKMVLNGSIFAWWGLYDYVLISKDKGRYREALSRTLSSLIRILPQFRCSGWSLYSLDGLIASPFYHNLHIAQMRAMFLLTDELIFLEYAELWERQQRSLWCSGVAFVKKAVQKIKE